ncbi:MAG: ABC transporter ATP-binding protein [Gordonia sp. (in: high G+C Gram-positive bacteria)]
MAQDGKMLSASKASGVELRAVTKRFGDVTAVDGIDLVISASELFAVLGPSGSGKTTILRMIAGFDIPTTGSVWLGGRDVTSTPPNKRDVNTVFQNYALFPHMTVRQNVEYGLKVRGVGRGQRRKHAGEMLDLVRLGDRGDARPAQLSGGQQQRVALARALVVRPRVLLLDEPLGALDLKLRAQMQLELRAIQREVGVTFVFVTHDQDEALTLCDRLAVVNEGRIEQIGPAREVYEHPANRFVADFVGTSNLIDGLASAALLGRRGMYTIRPERITVLGDSNNAPIGMTTTPAVVGEVVYAGPITRVVAQCTDGTTLTSILLNSSRNPGDSLRHGDRILLAWRDDAVEELSA